MTVNNILISTGEVWLSGEPIAKGYYNMPDLTRDNFVEEPGSGQRWFKTGDVGEFDEAGQLTIIDRKKDLVKLQGRRTYFVLCLLVSSNFKQVAHY